VGLVEPRPDEDGGDVDDAVGRGRRRVGSFRRVTSTCTRGDDEGHRDDESTAGGRKTRNSGRSSQRRRDSFDPAGFSRAERSNRRSPPPHIRIQPAQRVGLGLQSASMIQATRSRALPTSGSLRALSRAARASR
jgi:hypothetical protein